MITVYYGYCVIMDNPNWNNHYKNIDDWLEKVIAITLKAKVALCEHTAGPADGMPLLLWQSKDAYHVVPLPDSTENEPLSQIMFDILRRVWVELGTPKYGAVVCEAYVKTYHEEEGIPKNIVRGDIQKSYPTDLSIKECITFISFDIDGEIRSGVVPYKYDDAGQPKFEDAEFCGIVGGAMYDSTRNFLDFINAK